MIRTTTRFAFAAVSALAFASTVSAWDEWAPVAPKKIEVDLMANYVLAPEAGGFAPSLQVKYGIMEGLDVEAAVEMPTDPNFGVGKPNLAVKYSHASGFGGFVGLDIPLASEKIDSVPKAKIVIAAQYLKTFDKIVLNDWLMYSRLLADGAVGSIDLYLKPSYNVTDKIGPYLGLQYITSEKFEGYTFAVKPGVNVILTDAYSVEVNVPFTKAKGADLVTSVYLGVYGVF